RWVHVDAPRHLQLIPMSVLRRRGEALGLDPLLSTTADEGTLAWNRFGWKRSMANLLPRRPARASDLSSRILGRLLTALSRPVEESGSRGSAYTMVFRKGEAGSPQVPEGAGRPLAPPGGDGH